ncbi:MAG: winged helix-turn-helix domain-containing protein [Planctomycetota bacterium]|nr:MAG: winged helix-turn-helix domain-containing protein [Planctomycetota bacterium]
MHVANHHTIAELKRLIQSASDARQLLRLQVVLLAKQGRTAPQIAESLFVSRRNLQDWVYRYNAHGLEGLKDRRQGGNQRKIGDEQEQQVRDYLDQGQLPSGGVRRGEDLRAWIHKRFGVLYSLPGTYDLLHRLGYSCLVPRPRHKDADPQVQSTFKKTPRLRSSKSLKNTPRNASKSGSRTKPDSVNKGP